MPNSFLANKRIALVHDWLIQLRGGEKVLDQLAQLFPAADLYTLIHVPGSTTAAIESRQIFPSVISRIPGIGSCYRHLALLYPSVIERIRLDDYDLVISCSHSFAKGVVVRPGVPHICYCHTPIRYVWGPRTAYFRTTTSRILSEPPLAYLKSWDIRTSDKSRISAVISNSGHIRERVQRAWNRESTVVHPGIDTERFAISPRCPGNFFLMVGAFVPYKREDIAIDAFGRLGIPLLIAGDGPGRRHLEKSAAKNIKFLGRVSDQTLDELLATCRALIYPQEEDFGMVAVEAQAAGAPVIAYRMGGATETVVPATPPGGQGSQPTGLFFDAQTSSALIDAVRRFELVEHEFDPDAIRRHASRFSIERFRREFLSAISPWLS